MTTRKSKSQTLTVAELEAMSAAFERPDYSPRFARPSASEQARHDRALRAAKRNESRFLPFTVKFKAL
jgi:hypothetical protein